MESRLVCGTERNDTNRLSLEMEVTHESDSELTAVSENQVQENVALMLEGIKKEPTDSPLCDTENAGEIDALTVSDVGDLLTRENSREKTRQAISLVARAETADSSANGKRAVRTRSGRAAQYFSAIGKREASTELAKKSTNESSGRSKKTTKAKHKPKKQSDIVVLSPKLAVAGLLSSLFEMQQQGLFCDVTLVDKHGVQFAVHACVISCQSHFLYVQLKGKAKHVHVRLKSVDTDVLQACVQFMYGQEVCVTRHEVSEVRAAASILQLAALVGQCDKALAALRAAERALSEDDDAEAEEAASESAATDESPNKTPARESVQKKKEAEPADSASRPGAQTHPVLYVELLNGRLESIRPRKRPGSPESDSDEPAGDQSPPAFVSASEHDHHYTSEQPDSDPKVADIKTADQEEEASVSRKPLSFATPEDRVERQRRLARIRNARFRERQRQKRLQQQMKGEKPARTTAAAQQTRSDKARRAAAVKAARAPRTPRVRSSDFATPEEKLEYQRQLLQARMARYRERQRLKREAEGKPEVSRRPRRFFDDAAEKLEYQRGLRRHYLAAYKERHRFRLFTCKECNLDFDGYYKYRTHRAKEHATKYECELCDHVCINKTQLRQHMIRHHTKEYEFLCDRCDQRFVTRDELKYHMESAHGDNVYTCQLCSKTFRTRITLRNHVRRHNAIHKCVKCDFQSRQRNVAVEHYEREHTDITATCPICDRVFESTMAMKSHSRHSHRVGVERTQSRRRHTGVVRIPLDPDTSELGLSEESRHAETPEPRARGAKQPLVAEALSTASLGPEAGTYVEELQADDELNQTLFVVYLDELSAEPHVQLQQN